MHKLDSLFPRYGEFEPDVPVWCVTPEIDGCIHRFFDSSPISPSGRFIAVFQLPFEDRQPEPGEKGAVHVVDLETGKSRRVAETAGWEPQLGANINWGSSDHELFFNDVDVSEWRPFSWKLDIFSGSRARMEGGVYHASPDGKWLVSASLAAMRRTQPGYGVVVPEKHIPRNIGMSENDGFFLTDTATGKSRLLCSVRDLFTKSRPPPLMTEDIGHSEAYGFHSKFCPWSKRLMLSLRWCPAGEEPRLFMFKGDPGTVRYAWFTTDLEMTAVHCAAGPEQWIKKGHHATWFPDGENISMNLNIDGKGLRFVRVKYDGTGLGKMHDTMPGSGHPTVYPGERYILTDEYGHGTQAFGDGTVPIRWIDLEKGVERTVIRINTAQPCPDPVLRVDPHPAWDRNWRFAAFNGFTGGTRRVFIADMSPLVS